MRTLGGEEEKRGEVEGREEGKTIRTDEMSWFAGPGDDLGRLFDVRANDK